MQLKQAKILETQKLAIFWLGDDCMQEVHNEQVYLWSHGILAAILCCCLQWYLDPYLY